MLALGQTGSVEQNREPRSRTNIHNRFFTKVQKQLNEEKSFSANGLGAVKHPEWEGTQEQKLNLLLITYRKI